MNIRTLEEIRRERGEDIHGFVLMVTGVLPADEEEAKSITETIQVLVDGAMHDLEQATGSALEVTGLMLRMEKSEVYIAEGLPNGQ